MDFNLKQRWRDQQNESEDEQQHQQQQQQQQQHCAKIPRKMHLDSPQNHQQQQTVASALPLFVSEGYSDHSSTPTSLLTSSSTFSRVGGRYYFSMAQWQELEVQALIYRHMVAGAVIPPELLYLIKKSLLTSPYYLHHYPPHFQSAALMQAGYWGKGGMDAEPGRCRRTDGKKWRCSRDVVAGHKYCERHMHRGRNRSRKPVEFPASGGGGGGGSGFESLSKPAATFTGESVGGAAHFSVSRSGASGFDAFQLQTGSGEFRSDRNTLFDTQHDSTSADDKSNKVLMHFFDDHPKTIGNNLSSTSLSMATPIPENSTSNFLRLSTGNGDELGYENGSETGEQKGGRVSWTGAWGGNPVASMGGPLAEAFRSSSTSSPTGYQCSTPVA